MISESKKIGDTLYTVIHCGICHGVFALPVNVVKSYKSTGDGFRCPFCVSHLTVKTIEIVGEH